MIGNSIENVGVMKNRENKEERQLTAKELLLKMRRDNRNLFAEIANFIALLEELGVSSYKLTGSIQNPIITNYTIS